MPKLVNGSMQWTLAEATKPETLKGYSGEVVVVMDDMVTIKFPTMLYAVKWSAMADLEAQTWPSGPVLSFNDWVTVDVMDPEC